MKRTDYIEIHITGKKGVDNLSLDNYDVAELKNVLDIIIKLCPQIDKNDPLSLTIVNGSVKQIFKGSKQRIAMFSTILSLVVGNPYLEDIESQTAISVEELQKSAKTTGYTYSITTSMSNKPLVISPTTDYKRREVEWIDGELYLYGEVILTGGVNPKLHISTKEYGKLVVNASKDFLCKAEKLLYRECGIMVKAKLNKYTNEIDKESIMFVELIKGYTSTIDLAYIKHCIENASAQFRTAMSYDEWYSIVRG
jgi:hypothetical protein